MWPTTLPMTWVAGAPRYRARAPGPGWHDPGQMRSFLRAPVLVAALALTVTTLGAAVGPGAENAGAGTGAGAGSVAAPTTGCPPTCRVLIISIPTVSWADINALRLPHLRGLFAQSAIADLATRSVHQRTTPGDGYAALGAGARAVAAGSPGQNFEPNERYGDGTAAAVYERRTGIPLRDDIGTLSISSIVDANNGMPYDAKPGLLGHTLTDHGFGRAVIANADEDELEPVDMRYHREAVLSLIDTTGRVPAGAVGPELLQRDPLAPFGLRLDRDAVMRAFTKAWDARHKNVVLVEASDVARANAYRTFAAAKQRGAMRTKALQATDALVGRLLTHVDPKRDAVFVVGPYHSSLRREVTIAALRAPGVAVGFLKTGTTRRTGFVQIVDIAPTVLKLVGVDRPKQMEGRPFDVDPSSASYQARVKTLIRANRAAVFRDSTIGRAAAWLVVLTLALAAAALVIFRRRLVGVTQALEVGALGFLGFLLGTFVAGLLPFYRLGGSLYWGFLLVFALAYGLICHTLGRRHPADALLLALGGMTAAPPARCAQRRAPRVQHRVRVHADDRHPAGRARQPGLGPAVRGGVAVRGAARVAVRPPTGRRIAVAVLAVTVVVVGAPFFGQDFGGAISAAPAYLLLGLLLYGRRITVRAVALLGGVLVAAGLAVGFVDLARPADSRTHVGRFFEKVGDEGLSGFTTVVGRKLTLMLQTFRNTGWVLLVAGVLGALAYLAWRTDRLRALADAVPTLRAALISFAVLAVLATVLNDSGIQVMGMMLAVLVPTLVVLACRELVPPETDDAPVRVPEPA